MKSNSRRSGKAKANSTNCRRFASARLALPSTLMAIFCITMQSAIAGERLELPVTVSLSFDQSIPARIIYGGDVSSVINEQEKMKEKHKFAFLFDIDDPKEARLSVTANRPDQSFDTFSFSFVPSQLKKEIAIIFYGEDGTSKIFTQDFNDKALADLSRKSCNGTPADEFHLLHQFRLCYSIFKAYENNDKRHFLSAFRALKGAFDAYYKLIAQYDFGLARDSEIENSAVGYEAEAGSNKAIKSTFRSSGVQVGYFKGMVDQIGISMTNRFDRLRRDLEKRNLSGEEVLQSKIEADLLKKRLEAEQVRLQKLDGKNHKYINGISVDHFDAMAESISKLF